MSSISKKMMMPQNKREDLIFTVLNVVFMCTCMLIFNMFLSMGVSWDAVKQAWLLEPLTLVVVFCLEYFVGCPFVKMLMKKIGRPWMKPWMFTVLFQLFTVSLMVILESFYGALLTVGFSSEIWTTWIHHIPINWCIALELKKVRLKRTFFIGRKLKIFFFKKDKIIYSFSSLLFSYTQQ